MARWNLILKQSSKTIVMRIIEICEDLMTFFLLDNFCREKLQNYQCNAQVLGMMYRLEHLEIL